MKRILRIALLVCLCLLPVWAWGTTYYVNQTIGDDDNSGLTEQLPWKTLAKVSTFGQTTEYGPDDQILLKRGETWNERLELYGTGTSGHNVVYGAHGTGDDPIIRDIYHRNSFHENVTGNNEYITVQDMQISYSAGRGVDARTLDHITLRRLYIHNCGSNGIELNTEGASFNDWTITDVEIGNCSGFGVWSANPYTNVVVTNLTTHDNTRDGASFYYGSGNKCINCVAYNNAEDGFDMGGASGDPFYYINCLAYNNASGGFSVKDTCGGTGYIIGCVSYNNNEGIDVGGNANSTLYNNTVFGNDFIGIYLNNTATHIVKNNVIYNNGESTAGYSFQVSYLVSGQTLTADCNYYGVQSAARTIYVSEAAGFTTFAEWQAYDGNAYDQHGGSGDPKFYDGTMETQLVTNGTMEADSNWTDSGFDNGETNERSAIQTYKGSYSRHANVDDADEGFYSDPYPEEEGQSYRVVFRYYLVSGEIECRSTQPGFDTNSLTTTGSWMRHAFTYTATATRANQRIQFVSAGGAGAEFYIDEASIHREGAHNFALRPNSPCINAGTDSPILAALGDLYDMSKPTPLKVRDATTDQLVGPWGDGVDIGAIGYQSRVPLMGM